eukprot:scaffold772_cov339-Pavlova_lutheri.AAC.75
MARKRWMTSKPRDGRLPLDTSTRGGGRIDHVIRTGGKTREIGIRIEIPVLATHKRICRGGPGGFDHRGRLGAIPSTRGGRRIVDTSGVVAHSKGALQGGNERVLDGNVQEKGGRVDEGCMRQETGMEVERRSSPTHLPLPWVSPFHRMPTNAVETRTTKRCEVALPRPHRPTSSSNTNGGRGSRIANPSFRQGLHLPSISSFVEARRFSGTFRVRTGEG